MIRRVISIDEEKCTGCGLCVEACHEGAIGLVNGKAHLMRDDYCDGLGDCLPSCPTGAITFIEREAAAYDEQAVAASMASKRSPNVGHSCPGSAPRTILQPSGCPGSAMRAFSPSSEAPDSTAADEAKRPSAISSWPLEIKLVPPHAPYFMGAHLLVAADCTAFAYGDFHRDFMKGKTTVIGCPKLDGVDYSEKLSVIFAENDIASITVCRMEVPCCGGLEMAVKRAIAASGKDIPLQVTTFSLQGEIL